jgi:hypothetical protein
MVVLLELEPLDTGGGDGLSPGAAALVPVAIEQARAAALTPVREEVGA